MRSVMCGLTLLVLSTGVSGQSPSSSAATPIPPGATGLHGSPTVQVETTPDTTTRHALTAKEAKEHGLSISVVGGRYFLTSRQNEELTLRTSDEFIYLTTAKPGQYIRLRRINDRFTYVEHLDMGPASVTYFGELRIALGK